MPGMVGIISDKVSADLHNAIKNGVKRLCRKPWHHSKTQLIDSFALGVSLRKGSVEGGNVWISEKKDLVVAIDGEIYFGPKPKEKSMNAVEHPTSHCAA